MGDEVQIIGVILIVIAILAIAVRIFGWWGVGIGGLLFIGFALFNHDSLFNAFFENFGET